MKSILKLNIFLIIFSFVVNVNAESLRSCVTGIMGDNGENLAVEFNLKNSNNVEAVVMNWGLEAVQPAFLARENVRVDLAEIRTLGRSPEYLAEEANLIETIILSRASLTTPDQNEDVNFFSDDLDTGIEDLSKVHSANIFSFSIVGEMGLSAVVEAIDINGNVIGSFLNGPVVTPCIE